MEIKITDVRSQKGDAAFLIDDGTTSILYDTGFGFTGYAVAQNIKAQLGERKLDYIFLTHSHYDHALGSAYILRHYPTAKVVAASYAADVFSRDGAKRIMKELDAKFVKEATAAGFVNLKGHRSVGGMRASIYNAMPKEGVEKLVAFMKEFAKNNPKK